MIGGISPSGPGEFVLTPQAAGADFDAPNFPVHAQSLLVYVGQESGLGAPLGVAHVVARHTDFATDFTLHSCSHSLRQTQGRI